MIAFLKKILGRGVKTLAFEPDVIAPARDDAPRIFARLFASDDGTKVLAYLRGTVNTRVAGPEAPEALLHFQDGQRALLQTIQSLILQGRNPS